ncbi:MAG TPA: L-threonylcarbamoyladenylate synthase, partial [Deltaproteobacteria bacterium]|nr:L-threonylcarbamoyladenylate synthase [Deltaproteobacteria bacterium]
MLVTKDVTEVVSILAAGSGAVIAYPTETFYGLGSCMSDCDGIERIVRIKGRDASKGMIVLAADITAAREIAEISGHQEELLSRFWPGPLSAVLQARIHVHPLLSPAGKVALRVSPHPLALALTRTAGPITSTSANPSGMPPARTSREVSILNLEIDAILDGGETPGGLPSTLIDLTVWPPKL